MTRRWTAIAALLLCACAGGGEGGEAAGREAGDSVIGPGPLASGAYSLLDSAAVDLDLDGTAERVELSATVEVDEAGRPLWEDGHGWRVVVRDGEAAYPLLEEFVPWGTAAFWIVASDTAGPPAILVETRSRLSGRVGITAATFRFDPARRGFRREGRVEVSGEVLHGDPAGLPMLVPDTAGPGR